MNLLFMNVLPLSFRRFRGAGEARPARHRRYKLHIRGGGAWKSEFVPDFQPDTFNLIHAV